jgi:hypothetical protein
MIHHILIHLDRVFNTFVGFFVKDIQGYPDVWNIPASSSMFWDNSTFTRLIPTDTILIPRVQLFLTKFCTRGISIV